MNFDIIVNMYTTPIIYGMKTGNVFKDSFRDNNTEEAKNTQIQDVFASSDIQQGIKTTAVRNINRT